ncbi:MAG: FtsH protease activity modulator HflK [Gammaproteobacteria bacterium AqS3]|nr:FtsH protease activity modulator HflK [Gammaproteobacteria bacterium AqS3]
MNPDDKGGGWGSDSSGPPDLERIFAQLFSSGGGYQRWVIVAVVGLLVIWFGSGIYQVEERERAVVLRLGPFHEVLGPGLHWQPRFIDDVLITNVTELRTHVHSSSMLTRDENIVNVKLSVQYRVSDPKNYWLEISDPDETLSQASESALRHEVGSNSMDDVLVERRGPIQQEIQTRLQSYISDYNSGLEIVKVNIQEADPPEAVKDAFNDAIKAREDKNRLSNEAEAYANSILPQARGQSARLIQEATADRDKAIASAQGEADRFISLYQEYRRAPQLTRDRLYIETMEHVLSRAGKVVIDTPGGEGGNLIYLPLDRLPGMVGRTPSGSDPANAGGGYAGPNAGLPNVDETLLTDRIVEQVIKRLRSGTQNGQGTYRNSRSRR